MSSSDGRSTTNPVTRTPESTIHIEISADLAWSGWVEGRRVDDLGRRREAWPVSVPRTTASNIQGRGFFRNVDATRRLMAMFSPYRSLATAHLWQFNKPIPT